MNFSKFLTAAQALAPTILMLLGVHPVVAAAVSQGMQDAQLLAGATGAEKKAYVMDIAKQAITVVNDAKGRTVIPAEETIATINKSIDTAVSVINLVHGASPDQAA